MLRDPTGLAADTPSLTLTLPVGRPAWPRTDEGTKQGGAGTRHPGRLWEGGAYPTRSLRCHKLCQGSAFQNLPHCPLPSGACTSAVAWEVPGPCTPRRGTSLALSSGCLRPAATKAGDRGGQRRGEASTGVYFKPASKQRRRGPVGLASRTAGCRGAWVPPSSLLLCAGDVFHVTEKGAASHFLLQARRGVSQSLEAAAGLTHESRPPEEGSAFGRLRTGRWPPVRPEAPAARSQRATPDGEGCRCE